jgi:DNA-binding response OmpR family regulator
MSLILPKPLVLVIEEDRALSRLFTLGLPRYGFNVLVVKTTAEAVQALEKRGPEIAVALIDQDFPWPSWYATLWTLRRVKPALRSCFLESCGQEKNMFLAADSVFLPKPFGLEILAKTVHNLIKEALARPECHGRWATEK